MVALKQFISRILSVSALVFITTLLTLTGANAGNYGSSYSNKSLFGNYSTYKMSGYNYRTHDSLHRVNYKRHFTLHRVYDKDKRSYRSLRKINKKHH